MNRAFSPMEHQRPTRELRSTLHGPAATQNANAADCIAPATGGAAAGPAKQVSVLKQVSVGPSRPELALTGRQAGIRRLFSQRIDLLNKLVLP